MCGYILLFRLKEVKNNLPYSCIHLIFDLNCLFINKYAYEYIYTLLANTHSMWPDLLTIYSN